LVTAAIAESRPDELTGATSPTGTGADPGAEVRPFRRVVLVGNPNVGKSVLFKNLTQRYVQVSNFPGTTVEIARAKAAFDGRRTEVVDSPGVNDLSPRSEDAQVTRRLLDTEEDAVLVQVADAKNLRRALLLTLQLAERGQPMVLALNMLDELKARGGEIDTRRLSELLGIPVVETVAVRNQGTAELVSALPDAAPPLRFDAEPPANPGSVSSSSTASHASPLPRCGVGEESCATRGGTEYALNRARLARINEVLAETWSIRQPRHAPLSVRLGFWAMHPVKGLGLLALVLLAVFWFVGLFGAGTLVDLMEVGLFEQHLNPLAIRAADAVLPFPHRHDLEALEATVGLPVTPIHEVELARWETEALRPTYTLIGPEAELGALQRVARFLHDATVGQFGAVTMALSYALAIVLPIVTTFFLLFSLLEDSGYLPRMAILVNRVFRFMGLNGKAVLPMILGLGCDTMATMTTRILETRKERIVTTLLLALAVPCSAQLGVLLAMMAHLTAAGTAVWVLLMVGVVISVGWLTARLFPRGSSDFILEIPPLRRPQLANVATKTVSRLNWYLREVIPLFLAGTAGLFLLDALGWLRVLGRWGEPLVTGWLGLPAETANAFLVGFLRRDFGAVYLLDAATGPDPILSGLQILVAMVTITLFMPCIANFLMIAKEHGMKVAWAMAAFIFPFAFLMGGLVYRIGQWWIG